MRTGHILDSWEHPSGQLVALYEIREGDSVVVRDTVMVAVRIGESKEEVAVLIDEFVNRVALGQHASNGDADLRGKGSPHSHALKAHSFECKEPPRERLTPDPREAQFANYHVNWPEMELGEYMVERDIDGVTWLMKRGTLAVMFDSADEVAATAKLFAAIDALPKGGRILMLGLGIGFVLKYALANPNVAAIDVIELEPDVIELNRRAGTTADPRVTVHQGDATKLHLKGKWDIVWSDMWDDPTKGTQDWVAAAEQYRKQAGWIGVYPNIATGQAGI